jgi:hypothetical protein
MSSFTISSPSLPELKSSFNKVTRPIVLGNLPGFKISSLVDVFVSYNFSFTTSGSSIDGQLFLEVSSDNANWTVLNQSGLLTPSAPPVIKISSLVGIVPKDSYVRLRGQVAGSTSITYVDGTEYNLVLSEK